MFQNNFIKSIISKDSTVSQNALKELIATKNTDLFQQLADNSEFIFPFIKEKIVKNFIDLIKKENLDIVFELSKVYSWDFEDLIVESWLKFACEDLTDEILNLFESGNDNQRAYCAKYFSRINDSLALDSLVKYSKSDYEPLRTNCAIALRAFNYLPIIDEMKYIIENDSDEFKQLIAYQFLIAYNDSSLISYITKKALKHSFCLEITTYLKNYYPLETLKDNLEIEDLAQIFSILIENYPENIALNTIIDYQILDFIQLLTTKENYNQYIENILIIAKNKFIEFKDNEAYSFDLDKDSKKELDNIIEFLNKKNLDSSNIQNNNKNNFNQELDLFNTKPYRFDTALNVIKELKLKEYSNYLAQLINNNKLSYILLSKTAQVLKELDNQDLIDKNIIIQLDNDNVKALILSLLN